MENTNIKMHSGLQTANPSENDHVDEDFNRTGKVGAAEQIEVERLPLVKQKYASNAKDLLMPEKQRSEMVQHVTPVAARDNTFRFAKGQPLSGIQSRSGHDTGDLSEIVSTVTANLRIANADIKSNHRGSVMNRQELPAVEANTAKMGAIMANLGRVLKTESKVEIVVNLMDEISKQYGIKKATFYAIG